MNLDIRPLTENDFDIADTIFDTAFGRKPSPVSNMGFIHALQPDGRFIALVDGKPVGLVGVIDYGRMAYLGPVAVLPEYQRSGIGRALTEYIIAYVQSRGPRIILLEATPAGAHLYPKLGFVTDGRTNVYQLQTARLSESFQASYDSALPMRPEDVAEIASFDAPIFGDNRIRVIGAYLRALPERAFLIRDEKNQVAGYLFARSGPIGPWAARRRQDAETLWRAALTLPFEQSPSVVIPACNESGTHMLKAFGFTLERSMLHMRLGGDAAMGQRSQLYALATPGIG